MKEELLQKANLSNHILDIIGAVVLVMDKEGHIVLFNKASESITGYTFEEVKNKYPWDLFALPSEKQRIKQVFNRLTSGDFPNTHINYWFTKSSGRRLIDWSNTAIVDETGDIAFVIATGIDITKRREAEKEIERHQKNLEYLVAERTAKLNNANAKLEKLARNDSLTGVYNRRHFNEVIEMELRRTRRTKDPLSLVLCDVDYFKNYNDSYGHVAGDNCLKQVASALAQGFKRASDLVARFGGEEFAVILPGTNSKRALCVANNLLQIVRELNIPHDSSPISKFVTLSIGVATIQSEERMDTKTLLELADKELYRAKKQGRNRVRQCETNFVTE
ncbi:MAG: diguanylate cyclase [Gammaproteobacteria bacterium]|nr:diguanylate cyclase [Gammaproteobacteria bacterium]